MDIIKLKETILQDNDADAHVLREELKHKKICLMNLMSSPGSGKTTTLTALINMLKQEYKIGEMDVDIESSLDAQKVADATGVNSIQIHNGGLCHIDADMVSRALDEYDTSDLDLLFLENIGNLVCPAEFDTGAHKNVMLLSIPEGHDKPLKYPLMFSECDVVLINKIDTMDYFDFDMEKVRSYILDLNPSARILPISAKTGQGLDEVISWIKGETRKLKNL